MIYATQIMWIIKYGYNSGVTQAILQMPPTMYIKANYICDKEHNISWTKSCWSEPKYFKAILFPCFFYSEDILASSLSVGVVQ